MTIDIVTPIKGIYISYAVEDKNIPNSSEAQRKIRKILANEVI